MKKELVQDLILQLKNIKYIQETIADIDDLISVCKEETALIEIEKFPIHREDYPEAMDIIISALEKIKGELKINLDNMPEKIKRMIDQKNIIIRGVK